MKKMLSSDAGVPGTDKRGENDLVDIEMAILVALCLFITMKKTCIQ